MKIISFSQQGSRAICILAANGGISNVTLRQPNSSGGTLTYEVGTFSYWSLSHAWVHDLTLCTVHHALSPSLYLWKSIFHMQIKKLEEVQANRVSKFLKLYGVFVLHHIFSLSDGY